MLLPEKFLDWRPESAGGDIMVATDGSIDEDNYIDGDEAMEM